MKCPKCGFEQPDSGHECIKCGLVFKKFEAIQKKKEQLNSRYSPQSAEETEEGPAPPDGPEVVEPPPVQAEADGQATAMRELLQQVSTHFDRIQLGLQAALQSQESLAGELRNQRALTGQLFTLFGDVREAVDQKVLLVQGQLQQLRERQDSLAEEVLHSEHFTGVRDDLAQLQGRLEEFGLHQKEFYAQLDLKRRLEGLESLQSEVRAVLSGAAAPDAGTWANQETLLVKTELQALRAEVRTLMEQSPSPAGERLAILGAEAEKVQSLQVRLNQIQQELEEKTTLLRKELEPLGSRIQRLDEERAALAGQLAEIPALRALGGQLEQAYQALGTCWRAETDTQMEQLAACARRLDEQQQALADQGAFIRRLKDAVGS